jgi:hypothetical protein
VLLQSGLSQGFGLVAFDMALNLGPQVMQVSKRRHRAFRLFLVEAIRLQRPRK